MKGIAKLSVICIIIFLILILAHKEAITQQKWTHSFGGSNSDYAYSIQQTSDGGYIVAGYTCSFGAGSDDFWVLRLDSSGSVDWQKTYSGAGVDYAFSIQQTSDGGYIIAGFTYSFGAGYSDFWVLKLDSSGNITWQKTYGGTSYDYAESIQQTSDGGYIVAGRTYSFGAGYVDIWVLKLDSSGNVSWQKTYGGSGYDEAYSIKQTSDGGYVVAGYTDSFGAGSDDIWVLKLDSSGSVIWQKTYGGPSDDEARSIQQTSDGGYIVAGHTHSFGAGSYDFWVLKLDSSGNISWQKTYGGTSYDFAYSIQQTSDGDYIVAGEEASFGESSTAIWVLKLDSSGNVIWQKTYGGSSGDGARSIQQTSDGGYIVAGITYSFGAGLGDFWVLKLNSQGISCNIRENTSIAPASTSITPATSTATETATSVVASDSYAIVRSSTMSPIDQCTCQETFGDVTSSNPFCFYIERLFDKDITSGCSASPLLYCPKAYTQRDGMAKFVCLSMNSSSPGSCTASICAETFNDVPASNIFCPYIEGLYTAGIVNGCSTSPLLYCPTAYVRRDAMAKFICLGMNATNPGSCSIALCTGIFSDVLSSNMFCSYVEGLYNAGVAGGCTVSPLNYCPYVNISREQISKFIVNGFAL